jgi:hypothetical protein
VISDIPCVAKHRLKSKFGLDDTDIGDKGVLGHISKHPRKHKIHSLVQLKRLVIPEDQD